MRSPLRVHRALAFSVPLALVLAACASPTTQRGQARVTTAPVSVTSAEIKTPPRRCTPTTTSGRFGLIVLGSGGERSGDRASSSFVVVVDGTARVLVDAGTGSFARMMEAKIDLRGIDTVLLTHMHEDHVGDFARMLKARDAASDKPVTLRVFGPTGADRHPGTRVFVERIFGREGAFATPDGYRNAFRIDGTDVDRTDRATTLTSDGGVVIKAISVDHGRVPSLAYRLEHAGRTIVFSGDLAGKNDNLIQLAHSADLLVQDAAVLDAADRGRGAYEFHTPPRRIGQIAARAPVADLLLTHMPNDVRNRQAEVLDSIRNSFGGDVRIADDCMVVTVAD